MGGVDRSALIVGHLRYVRPLPIVDSTSKTCLRRLIGTAGLVAASAMTADVTASVPGAQVVELNARDEVIARGLSFVTLTLGLWRAGLLLAHLRISLETRLPTAAERLEAMRPRTVRMRRVCTHRFGVAALVAAVVAGVVTPATGIAGAPGAQRVRITAEDQASARAVVIRRSDLGPAAGWIPVRSTPDPSPVPKCAAFHPDLSGLVVTGLAAATWRNGGLAFDSQATVLQTRQMVQRDWQLEVASRALVPCLRSYLTTGLGSQVRVRTFRRIPFARIAPLTAAFLGTVDVRSGGRRFQMTTEAIFLADRRTEITLVATAPSAAWAPVSAAALRLARIMLARARA